VSLQEPGPGEALATVRTLAALVMSPDVHREGRHGHIHLVAVRAATRFLVAQRSVRLTVPGQVAGCAVALPTVRTAVGFVLKRTACHIRSGASCRVPHLSVYSKYSLRLSVYCNRSEEVNDFYRFTSSFRPH
jgi:hypothetical protein